MNYIIYRKVYDEDERPIALEVWDGAGFTTDIDRAKLYPKLAAIHRAIPQLRRRHGKSGYAEPGAIRGMLDRINLIQAELAKKNDRRPVATLNL